jgi:hypothetical protein
MGNRNSRRFDQVLGQITKYCKLLEEPDYYESACSKPLEDAHQDLEETYKSLRRCLRIMRHEFPESLDDGLLDNIRSAEKTYRNYMESLEEDSRYKHTPSTPNFKKEVRDALNQDFSNPKDEDDSEYV